MSVNYTDKVPILTEFTFYYVRRTITKNEYISGGDKCFEENKSE